MAQPSVVRNKVKFKSIVRIQLTAGNLHGAFLCIKRIHLEVHGTGESERHPDTEEDRAVSVQPDVEVGNENIVHGAAPLVPEESVRHPDLADVGQSQVFDFICQEK